MAYWYTYPDYNTDNSDTEEELTEQELKKMYKEIQKRIDFELDFFMNLGKYPALYKFGTKTQPDAKYWKKPPLHNNALFHLYDLVDQNTLDIIKSGLEEYKTCDIRATGKSKWTKDDLKIIFKYAQIWVDGNNMGRNDYINDICWVVSKIISFQLNEHYPKWKYIRKHL